MFINIWFGLHIEGGPGKVFIVNRIKILRSCVWVRVKKKLSYSWAGTWHQRNFNFNYCVLSRGTAQGRVRETGMKVPPKRGLSSSKTGDDPTSSCSRLPPILQFQYSGRIISLFQYLVCGWHNESILAAVT